MLLGLISDIHERFDHLQVALRVLRARSVDRVVVLGDVYDAGDHIDETIGLLQGIGGVFGNHELGLCGKAPSPEALSLVSPSVGAWFATLLPSLKIKDARFQHIEPHLDPDNPIDNLGWRTRQDVIDDRTLAFRRRSERLCFMGHIHTWLIADEAGEVQWDARSPIVLTPPRRYLIVVHALCSGHFATYDTSTAALTPLHVDDHRD